MRNIIPREPACYCIRVRRAASALTKFYDQAFEPIGLTVSQFSLLNAIKALKTCNKSELAAYAKLDRTTIIRNLRILLEKNLITEAPGEDKRSNLIQLTELGLSAIDEGRALWAKTQEQVKAAIGLEHLEDFFRILKNIEELA